MKVHHISWYVPMSHDIPSFVGENPPFYSESHGARRVPWRQRAQNARQSLQQAMQGPVFWGRYPWHLFLLAPPKHENWGTIQLLLVCLICQNCEPTWMCLKSETNWVNPSEMAILPIDLQRALFSVHSIFWLDFPPFRLFVHTWGAECTLVSWQAGIYASTGYFGATSREETNRIFTSKPSNVVKSGALSLFWRKCAKYAENINLPNQHRFVLFGGCWDYVPSGTQPWLAGPHTYIWMIFPNHQLPHIPGKGKTSHPEKLETSKQWGKHIDTILEMLFYLFGVTITENELDLPH